MQRRKSNDSRSNLFAWRVLQIALQVTVVALGIFLVITILRLVNASDETRRCLDIRRFNVKPTSPLLAQSLRHEPSAFGYLYINSKQRFVRWRLADDYTSSGLPITDINLHGPLTPESPDVAPVALDLKPTRIDSTQYFVGNATASTRLLVDIDNDPSSYYMAFYTGVNTARREIGRDSLNKIC